MEGSYWKDQQMCDKYLDKLRSMWIHISIGNQYCAAEAMPAVKVSTITLSHEWWLHHCDRIELCFIVWLEFCIEHGCGTGCPCCHWCHHQSSQSQLPLPNNNQLLLTFVTTQQLFSHAWLVCLPSWRVFNNSAVILRHRSQVLGQKRSGI